MELHIEKINVSDNKFLVTKLHQQNGAQVKAGDLIYSIESSKASKDVTAPCDGYLFFANGVKEFDEYPANFLIAQIVETNENPFAKVVKVTEATEATEEATEEVNVIATKEALAFAAKHGVDLSKIDADYITKWDVLEYIKTLDAGNYGYNSTIKKVAIIGAGVASCQVIDLISHLDGYTATCIFDDTPEKQNTYVYGVKVIGKIAFDSIAECYYLGMFDYIVNSVGGSIPFRKKCFEELTKLGVPYCNLIHPTVVIGQNVKMGTGNIIYPMTNIGPNAKIANDCLITAQTDIEHHNIIGSHCTFGPGVKLSGTVHVGDCTRFAAGIFVEPWINIGSNCTICSGSIITNHIPDNMIVRTNIQIDLKDISGSKSINNQMGG